MELVEVEIVRRQMEPRLLNQKVASVKCMNSKRFTDAKKAAGGRITGVKRHGKYLILGLGNGKTKTRDGHGRELIFHLGMSGSLRLFDISKPTEKREVEEDKYIRAKFLLKSGDLLTFRDVRRFGRILVVPKGDYSISPTLHKAGPDALSGDFTPEQLYEALKKSSRAVKTQLLSQMPVAGLGNIYADEALWAAGISPLRRKVSKERAKCLHKAIVQALNKGFKYGGTTLRDYRTFLGTKGTHQDNMNCYGRAGEPCKKCGKNLVSIFLGGRTATYCKACQK